MEPTYTCRYRLMFTEVVDEDLVSVSKCVKSRAEFVKELRKAQKSWIDSPYSKLVELQTVYIILEEDGNVHKDVQMLYIDDAIDIMGNSIKNKPVNNVYHIKN